MPIVIYGIFKGTQDVYHGITSVVDRQPRCLYALTIRQVRYLADLGGTALLRRGCAADPGVSRQQRLGQKSTF